MAESVRSGPPPKPALAVTGQQRSTTGAANWSGEGASWGAQLDESLSWKRTSRPSIASRATKARSFRLRYASGRNHLEDWFSETARTRVAAQKLPLTNDWYSGRLEMRWNPRRRQVTSVVYVQGPKKGETPKSPWNSLERAKLVVSALTPLLIAIVGITATVVVHFQDVARAQKEELRVKKATADPLIEDMQATISQVSTVLLAADISMPRENPEERGKTLRALSDTVLATSRRLHEDSNKLMYLINDPDVSSDLSSTEIGESILISTAFNCVASKGEPGKPQCSAEQPIKQLSQCTYAKTLALRMFEFKPVNLDGIDTRECHMHWLVAPTDVEVLKRAQAGWQAMAASAAAAVAAGAASH